MTARQAMVGISAMTALVLGAVRPATAAGDGGADRARALGDAAVRENRSLKAIEARIDSLKEQVERAGVWPDPQVSVDYSNMPINAWRPGQHPMSGIQLGLKQKFLFPGKTGLREAVAKSRVREAKASLAEREVQLRAMVERAYYQLALVRQLRQVTLDHIKLVSQFLDVVRVKYEVGKAGQQDLLRLQVLENKLRDDLDDFLRDDRALTAEINSALHRSTKIELSTPKQLSALAAPKRVEDLLLIAAKHRPLLRELSQRAKTRRLAAKQMAREGYPDLTAWAGYRIRLASGDDPGTDFVGFGISVPIPIWYQRRWGSARRSKAALAKSAERRREAELDRIRGELGQTVAAWQRAAKQARVYRGKLMPLAHRALDATFAAYQVDRADFAALFQAELQLLAFERTIRRSESATYVHRVHAESLIGERL